MQICGRLNEAIEVIKLTKSLLGKLIVTLYYINNLIIISHSIKYKCNVTHIIHNSYIVEQEIIQV